MVIVPGQKGVVRALSRISIHGAEYLDVVIADPAAPDDPDGYLTARLGPEAVVGDVVVGDRVLVEGFLRMITRIEKVG
jgi:hypothetical protein